MDGDISQDQTEEFEFKCNPDSGTIQNLIHMYRRELYSAPTEKIPGWTHVLSLANEASSREELYKTILKLWQHAWQEERYSCKCKCDEEYKKKVSQKMSVYHRALDFAALRETRAAQRAERVRRGLPPRRLRPL